MPNPEFQHFKDGNVTYDVSDATARAHIESALTASGGIHGIRYYKGTLAYYDSTQSEWVEIETGSGGIVELTAQEFSQLTEEEKNANVIYIITDGLDGGTGELTGIFTGTHQQWNALTDNERAVYSLVFFTDDYETTTTAFVGATSESDGVAGIVPKPLINDRNKFLKGDGTWAEASNVASLSDLTDTSILEPENDEVLEYSNNQWSNSDTLKKTKQIIADVETSPATSAHAVGTKIIYNNVLYKVTSAISANDTLSVGTNIALDDSITSQIDTINESLTNPNLLDNPWFTVNQRGKSSYTGLEYTVDRWKATGNATTAPRTITVNSDGSVSVAVQSDVSHFSQYLDDTVSKYLVGKTVTVSVNITALTSSAVRVRLRYTKNSAYYGEIAISVSETGIHYVTGTIPSDADTTSGAWTFEMYETVDATTHGGYSVKAVKLELGTVSTLANDVAPNYQQELDRCRRYYFRRKFPTANTNIATCLAQANNTALCDFVLPVPMRTTPTLTMSDYTKFSLMYTSGVALTALPVITDDSEHEHISMVITRASLTAGRVYELQNNTADAYIEFSADL